MHMFGNVIMLQRTVFFFSCWGGAKRVIFETKIS